MRGRPIEAFRFQDGDSIVTVSISRTARPRGEIGHRPDRSTVQADKLSDMVRAFVIGTESKYRWPPIELPPVEDREAA